MDNARNTNSGRGKGTLDTDPYLHINQEGRNPMESTAESSQNRKPSIKRPSAAENKKRRSTLLGNLMAHGRLSRGMSMHRITHHLTQSQRERKDEILNLPREDYYLSDDLDSMGIFLEKMEDLPGAVPTFTSVQQFISYMQVPTSPPLPGEEGEERTTPPPDRPPPGPVCPPPPPEEPVIPPEDAVFPVARNTVELQSKLNIVRNLRTYHHHEGSIDEGKCYYAEDEVDLSFLTMKPKTFLILGKPGIGKTTLGKMLAEKLHSIHLNPEAIIEYFRGPVEPLNSVKVNEILENGESIGDGVVVELLQKRIREFDVLHRGYVMDGFPMVTSDDLPIYEQLETLKELTLPPEHVIIMQMQDKDLFKRRITQKYDPSTGKVYTEQEYSNFDSDDRIFDRHREKSLLIKRVSTAASDQSPPLSESEQTITEDLSDTEKAVSSEKKSRTSTPDDGIFSASHIDFPKISLDVLQRLFYRTEDFNIIVNDDLESFRYNFAELQHFVQDFDKRKMMEVDAYWSPSVIFRRVWEFFEAINIQSVPVPVQIMRPLAMLYYKNRDSMEVEGEEDDDEDDDEDADRKEDYDEEGICQEFDTLPEANWVSALRAVTVRGLVDPRFRWRVSRWLTLCPVALKLGRSIEGKPDLAVSFMDKVFFMSSKHAVDQFINNPRPYLLPKMPTSPIKFIVIGHPLAGKTTFATELAALTDATVIDIEREVTRRFAEVKRDFLWRKRLKYTLEATQMVNMENALRWQKQERARRRDMHAWIENHLKSLAEAEIEAALERDREMLHKIRTELRLESEYHAMGEPFGGDGMCQTDDAKLRFNWKRFIQEAFGGKRDWTHQELLQLAWELFRQRRLYYKKKKRDSVEVTLFGDFTSESDEEYGLVSDVLGKGTPSVESSEETTSFDDHLETSDDQLNDRSDDDDDAMDDEPKKARKKRRKDKKKRKVKCRRIGVKPVEPEDIVEPFLFETFDVDPDDPEVEESIYMRFPTIPFELVDIVPSPGLVSDSDPIVQIVVDEKLARDAEHMDTVPAEIFVEILKRSCTEVEVNYRKNNRHGAMSGGWIIENFPPDIEKWRALLRTPKVCPDQVFLLLDLTEANMTIWSRFKRLFRILHPKKPPSAKTQRLSTRDEIPGEDGMKMKPMKIITPRTATPGEHLDDYLYPPALIEEPATTETDQDEGPDEDKDVDKKSIELISKSHFILSLLPRDNLLDAVSMSSSEVALVSRDLHRNRTAAFSTLGSVDDLQKLMDGHEKYILESLEKEFAESEVGSYTTLDYEEAQQGLILPFKPIYVEMSACLEEVDAFNERNGIHHVSSGSGTQEGGTNAKTSIKNPPGTPEPGFVDPTPVDYTVPVPPEIESGDIKLTPEELEVKTELEADIRRLSLQDDDYIRTPTEMGSAISIVAPGTADSRSKQDDFVQRLRSANIESPKKKFFAQIRMFNEFWNMALPVCNQQGVRYWEVGLCDEETSLEKSVYFWNELENRFDAKPKKILEPELKEEDEEILESFMKWGEPYDFNDIRFRSATSEKPKSDGNEVNSDTNDDSDDERNSGDDTESNEELKKEKDELKILEHQPDQYWKAERRLEAERCFGDFKYYCPVAYSDHHVLRKGSSKHACKFKDRIYYCSNDDNQLRFLVNPRIFLPVGGPPKAPPPRICITGSPGCLQEEVASQMCNEFKICYVNFRQRLHEIMKARFGRHIGPDRTGQIVSKEQTQKIVGISKPADDLLYYPDMPDALFENDPGEGRYESEVEIDLTFAPPVLPNASGIQNIPAQELVNPDDQWSIQETTLKSLGLLSQTNIETIPISSIERTERLTERKWEKLTRTETYIQGFLENGIQLPDDVLDEFISPMWKEAPFTEVGFILVGFPNSDADVDYMIRRNLIPEHVFVMECKSVAIRNRLIVPAVDRWHKEQNPSGKRHRKLSWQTKQAKLKLNKAKYNRGKGKEAEIFEYQVNGRPTVEEYENETWTYNDSISRDISRALKYYHSIYTAGLEKMKRALNHDRICWTPINTNTGLYQGKHKVINYITPLIKYRTNVFEDTVRLSFKAAQALLDRGVFTLSRLYRWCPVELAKGNTGINLWNAPGVMKIPYLHRRFIYFIAGEKNAKEFEENTFELTNQLPAVQPVPLVCMVIGHPKSGKTTLAKKLAQKLGLLYTSGLEVIESVLTHSFVTQWAQVLSEVNPALAATGQQPMTLSNEILEYIREGRAIPRFLMYRCLDLFLMNPKAQCQGVVFDDFPTILDELIELNYREMSPCLVLNLKIPITEAYTRCDNNRKLEISVDTVPEEAHECIDYLWDHYDQATKDMIQWFAEEYQNVHIFDGRDNPEKVYNNVMELCSRRQKKVQEYLLNLYYGRPNTLEGTCPITSTLFHRLTTEFGFFCTVALNDNDELVSVREISDLSQVVEYKGQIYLFSSKNAVRKFMNNPKKYTVPCCLRTPPKDIPQTLTVTKQDFDRLQEHWGFMDFDPVLYYANHHYKGLQRGDSKHCVVYRGKLYVFINEENQRKFLRKPSKYWNLLLPMKIPRKAEPINYDKITPFCYLSSKGMIPILRRIVKLMAEKRPRGPFLSVDQCAALYMGYYLKSQNMNSPFERRQKYRDAMFKMSTLKSSTRDFLSELQKYYGCRNRNLPEHLRKQLDDFLKFEHVPLHEKIHIPKIPEVTLGYDAVKPPFSEPQVARKVRRMMENMKEVELREKLDAFSGYSKRKKAAEDAAERAKRDAQEAAEMAKRIEERLQARVKSGLIQSSQNKSFTSGPASLSFN